MRVSLHETIRLNPVRRLSHHNTRAPYRGRTSTSLCSYLSFLYNDIPNSCMCYNKYSSISAGSLPTRSISSLTLCSPQSSSYSKCSQLRAVLRYQTLGWPRDFVTTRSAWEVSSLGRHLECLTRVYPTLFMGL